MNKLLKNLNSVIVFILLIPVACLCQTIKQDETDVSTQEQVTNLAYLTLDCLYSGLSVYVDGDSVGVTPLQEFGLNVGSHCVIVQNPKRSRWYQENWQHCFEAISGQHHRFNIAFPKLYIINTIPFGAEVFSDGKKLGTTPVTVSASPDSQVEIKVKKNSFKTIALRLGEQEEGEIRLSLEYIPGWQQQNAKDDLIQHQRLRRKRRGLYTSIAISTLFGMSTIYFRNLANDEYSNYMHAGNPDDMQHHYDRTKHYDKIAGISYTLFQVGFVLTGYYFLTSRGE